MIAINKSGSALLAKCVLHTQNPFGAAGLTTVGKLKEGDSVEVSRRITESDVQAFASLTGDRNQIHLTGDKPVVHGALLNSLVSAVIGTKLPGHGTVVLDQSMRFPQPCYLNEEVRIHVELSSLRKIVKVDYNITVPAEKKTVLTGSAKLRLPST